MFCHTCGSQIAAGAQFCAACGTPLPTANPVTPSSVYIAPIGVHAQSGRWIGEGWAIVKADLWMFALLTLVISIINIAILTGPLYVGMHIYIMKRMFGRRAEFGDLFQGFNFFLPSLVAWLLITIFTGVASIFFIIPGLIVAAMYKFTYLFIFDKGLDFWPAMQASHAVVKNDYLGFTLFLLLLICVNILGVLCCFVGLLVTIPISLAAITVAYRDIVGFEAQTVNRY